MGRLQLKIRSPSAAGCFKKEIFVVDRKTAPLQAESTLETLELVESEPWPFDFITKKLEWITKNLWPSDLNTKKNQ